jgi:hypothetical protein
MIPQRVHTMRGPNVGNGTSSDHVSAFKIARWWHCQHDTSSDRTPLAHMLPRVIGSIGSLTRLATIGPPGRHRNNSFDRHELLQSCLGGARTVLIGVQYTTDGGFLPEERSLARGERRCGRAFSRHGFWRVWCRDGAWLSAAGGLIVGAPGTLERGGLPPRLRWQPRDFDKAADGLFR